MAIVIDKTNIGEVAINATATTVDMTTSAAVASGGFIVLVIGWWNNASQTLSSVSGGSLTWTIDKQGNGGDNAGLGIASAQAPSGLASSTTLTATFSASAGGRSLVGTSFTGVATSSPVDVTTGPTSPTVGTAWETASTTILAGSLFIAGSCEMDSDHTNTVTSPSIEAHDVNGGSGTFSCTTCYRIEASAGSYTIAGTWSSSCRPVVDGVAYKAAAVTAIFTKSQKLNQAVKRSTFY